MSCIALIPIYKTRLDLDEERNLRYSLANLTQTDCVISWLAPDGIDRGYYESNFSSVTWSFHAPEYFKSVRHYSRLLLTNSFYAAYDEYEWMLIVQPDALVLKPSLSRWLDMPFDYIGAPWPSGWEYSLPIRTLDTITQVKCRAFVGNGGLSLRRPRKVIELLEEFPEARQAWREVGNPEDLLISMLATISNFFLVPNVRTAAQFSIELDYSLLNLLNHGEASFGVHGPLVQELFNTRTVSTVTLP